MKRAAVSTLKATLSACLAKVKAGNEVLVSERGRPVPWILSMRCLAESLNPVYNTALVLHGGNPWLFA
jgi:hypothetical protein